MQKRPFIVVGEKIHCTRIFKTDGARIAPVAGGGSALTYTRGRAKRALPVPRVFLDGPDWASGKVKHCAVAIWQALNGENEAAQAAGVDYLVAMAEQQAEQGAHYLDVNVDEYTTDSAERAKVMRWLAALLQKNSPMPLSIDSSNLDTLRAGLGACDRGRGRPLLNSVSLERGEAIALTREFDTNTVMSAAGETSLPSSVEERLANLDRLAARMRELGRPVDSFFIDPLVFPIASDGRNGLDFIQTVAAVRKQFGPAAHITGGFSNVSYGLPNRKLINEVFTWLARDAGADSGIVDPSQINGAVLDALDPESKGFKLARALLMNEDEFGMAFISASRDGEI